MYRKVAYTAAMQSVEEALPASLRLGQVTTLSSTDHITALREVEGK